MTEPSSGMVSYQEAETVLAGSGEVGPLLALWSAASDRGWVLTVDRTSQAWSIAAPGKATSAGFEPPNDFSTGVVHCYDPDRTLTLTGVAGHGDAVDRIREFLGWHDAAVAGVTA